MLRPKISWLLTLLVSLTVLLAACSETTSINEPPPVTEPGSIQLILQGIPEAEIMVALGGETIFDGMVVGSQTLEDLEPGRYAVDGMPAKNCTDPTVRMVTVEAGETTRVDMVYIQHDSSEPEPVAKLEIKAVKDDAGKALPGKKEINDPDNPVKDVMLYAAQTEEPVCVMVEAKDSQGQPVENATIAVNISDGTGLDDRIAILRGCANDALSINTQAFRDGIYTDSEGMASFTLYATYGKPEEANHIFAQEPAKVVIAAENDSNNLTIAEFKAFFFNLAHLYFNDAYTGQRIDASYSEDNIFNPLAQNKFGIEVDLFTKQPRSALDIKAVGFMHYEIVKELNKQGQKADVVHFEDCTKTVEVGLNDICKDSDGFISIAPNPAIRLKDMPVEATVEATLVVQVEYGEHTYNFRLKDFRVTKRWHGSYLSITKEVDHHVLTWAGPEHHLYEVPEPELYNLTDKTLAAKNDPAIEPASVFTATYDITVKNEGSESLYDITIADALPAELGVITSSLSPAGGTYDAINHVVTWNWLSVNDARFDKLEPGESLTATIEVYVRQKPGFCMDTEDVTLAKYYQVEPVGQEMTYTVGDQKITTYCYEDPYELIDGKDPNDVTATYYTGAHMGDGGYQVKVDFIGAMHKDDVIIHAVRPLFSIEKTLVDPQRTVEVGTILYFDIDLANLDRAEAEAAYKALESSYPAEFKGPRYNPYGRNIQVKDVFDIGLDFVSSSPITLKVGGGSYDDHFSPDKAVLWDTIPLMKYRDTGKATLALRANLPSPVDTIIKEETGKDAGVMCVPEEDYWYNCAFLDADNLNQPETEAWNAGMPWTQIEMRSWEAEPLHHTEHENLRYGIRDCEPVKVVPPPGSPWIELDSESEYDSGNPNVADELPGVSDGDVYYYFFTITNTGIGTAKGVTLETKLDCSGDPAQVTATKAAHQMWEYNATTTTWEKVANASFAGPEDGVCTVRFAGQDLGFDDPDPVFLYSIEVTANDTGEVHATAKADYSNASLQESLLPLEAVEDTAISP